MHSGKHRVRSCPPHLLISNVLIMRDLLVTSLAALGLASAFAHPTASGNNVVHHRKTLSFGPVLPHSIYSTEPRYSLSSLLGEPTEPYDVAQRFVEDLTRDTAVASSFVIRKDSYTDENTGVTHVYVCQYLHGIEVADGDINVNVKDAVVLSYGNSFHHGVEEDLFLPASQTLTPSILLAFGPSSRYALCR